MRIRLLWLLVLAAPCLLAAPASAEVYTWTDERGQVHMTDDLSTVPPQYRKGAERPDQAEASLDRRWNHLPRESPAWKGAAAPSAQAAVAPGPGGARRHVLHVERAGREMVVRATLDGGVQVPFVVDTGAMLNTIPLWAVRQLGLEFDADTASTTIVGIGGQPMTVPVVTIRRVKIRSVVVENVEMAVLDTMSKGLLGMTFFNNFRVSTDPIAGTLTLEEIDLNAVEGIHGGLDEKAWRNKFKQIHHQIAQLERSRENIPGEFETIATPYRERVDEELAYWEHQLNLLEAKASRAGVPQTWRE
jgi:clan AA aspartic protease (TIGR02281 family)